jgi:hypothetical protein
MKQQTDSKCRKRYKAEHINILLRDTQLLHHLDTLTETMKLAECIRWAISNDVGLQVCHKYYELIPERVMNVNGTAVMWYVLKTEKPSKYKGLAIEGSRMWKARTKIVPVIRGALGTIRSESSVAHRSPGDRRA